VSPVENVEVEGMHGVAMSLSEDSPPTSPGGVMGAQ